MSRRIALDASVAGYFVVKAPKAGQETLSAQARALLDAPGLELLLPTPALAEVLAQLPEEERDNALFMLEQIENLHIVSFAAQAARIAARVRATGTPTRSHQFVKFDIQIAACAVRWNATGLCALDGDHVTIVAGLGSAMEVGPPSRFLVQQPLI